MTETIVRDSKSGRSVSVHGLGALKGHLSIKKGLDLTKPIASQAMKGAKAAKVVSPRNKHWFLPGILLDSHALYWLVSGEEVLTEAALFAIGEAQQAEILFVSPITAWELAVASQKGRVDGRPNLGEDPPAVWFRKAIRATGARIIPIQQRISCEAANVVIETGHKDPGDCFLMATARVRRIPVVTRDALMQAIASEQAEYLRVIPC